jgi:hypothetical protein
MQIPPAYAPTEISPILLDIEQRLRDLKTAGPPEVAAFGEVQLYDLSDLGQAMQELYLTADSVALVVLESVEHESRLEGIRYTLRHSFKVSLILANRFYTTRRAAMMGEGGSLGLLALAELAVISLSGQASGYTAAPESGEMFALGSTEASHPDRLAFCQPFTIIPIGLLVEQMDRGTTRRPR